MKNTYKKASTNTKSEKTAAKNSKPIVNLSFLTDWKDKVNGALENKTFQRITGLSFMLTSAYFLIAFTSFLFTWKADQDKLFNSWSDLLFDPSIVVENWLGKLGAIISHQFIHVWFGVPSFLFVLLTFLIGFRILFKINLLPFAKTLKHSIFILIWTSAFFGYFFPEKTFLGGGLGFHLNNWLVSILGSVGAGFFFAFALLVFAFISYSAEVEKIILLFKSKPTGEESSTTDADGFDTVSNVRKESTATSIDLDDDTVEAQQPAASAATNDSSIPEVKPTTTAPAANAAENTDDDFETVAPPPKPEPKEKEAEVDVEVEDTSSNDQKLSEKDVDKKVKDFGEFDPTLELGSYKIPSIELLKDYGDGNVKVDREELEANKNRIVETLGNYNIGISKIKATIGPTVTLYEIVPEAGVRISKIKNLEDDIALSLAALGIRIIAPIPGKGTIGIEVPNQNPDIVSMKTVIASEKFQNSNMELPVALGKTISNETFIADLAKMPHLLMAGATGQGKSVGLNAILVSLLYKKHPSQVKFVLVDPKKVELTLFNKIERHFLAKLPGEEEAIITDTKKVVNTLNSLCIEMDQRYEILKTAQCRNIKEYNAKFVGRKLNPNNGHRYLPYIVLVVDEFADLIMTAGKEVETPIARLAQLARAIGIHLIIATQRPSVNVITGIIKANFPARIAFRVTAKIDSRTILDAGGADQLIGRGDMLYSPGSEIVRIQCAFVDTPEVEKIVEDIGDQRGYPEALQLPEYVDESAQQAGGIDADDRDALFEDAARIVVMHQQGSASLLQRKLKLGYNRAGRIVDQLEAAGIIGPHEGSKARQVLYPDEYSLEQFLNAESENTNNE